jgi:hypothetical protein
MTHNTQRSHVFHDQKVLILEKYVRVKMEIYNATSLDTFSSEAEGGKGATGWMEVCSLNRPYARDF